LNFVVTSRASQKIRHYIQAEEKARSIELGRRLFEKEARRFDLNAKTLSEEALLKAGLEHGLHKLDDLYAALGYGKLSSKQILLKILPPDQLRERPPEGAIASMVRRVWKPGEDKIKVRGVDDLLVSRARCCNPIRGEKIVGYISRGKGVSVHSASCTNVVNLMYDPERRIAVEWDSADDSINGTPYVVRLKVQVEDKKGMLAAVSTRVSGMNTNIKAMEATTADHRGELDMTVEVKDMKHLEKVIKSIRDVNGVIDVERVYSR
jgi:guanosine-3',5'-bis(diphosphate) 3'-pyrophosphohydrolase